jgi:hypothetical protein
MKRVHYTVSYYTADGNWHELPPCLDYQAAAFLVEAMLRASEQVGEVVKVIRNVDFQQE